MTLRHCKWDEGCIIQSYVVIYCGLSWIWRGLFIYLWSTCFAGATNDHNFPKRFSPPTPSWAILRTLVSLAHSTAFLWKTGLVWPPKPACFLSSAGTSWQKTCGIVDMVWLYPNKWPSDRCQQFEILMTPTSHDQAFCQLGTPQTRLYRALSPINTHTNPAHGPSWLPPCYTQASYRRFPWALREALPVLYWETCRCAGQPYMKCRNLGMRCDENLH